MGIAPRAAARFGVFGIGGHGRIVVGQCASMVAFLPFTAGAGDIGVNVFRIEANRFVE